MRMFIALTLTVGIMWLVGYGFANSRIIRIAIFTIFGAISAFYLFFGALGEIGVRLENAKRRRERKKERK